MTLTPQQTEKLLKYASGFGVDVAVARRVINAADTSLRDWNCQISPFLTPLESGTMIKAVQAVPNIVATTWGGYSDAERCVIVTGHGDIAESENLVEMVADKLVLVRISGNFEFDQGTLMIFSHVIYVFILTSLITENRFHFVSQPNHSYHVLEVASHRDFMGTILGAGVNRETIGDILVLDNRGAQAIVTTEMSSFLVSSITSVRSVKVAVDVVSLEDIEIPPKRVKELQSVETSMRLDAVVSGGLGMSRTKMADLTRRGLVFLNYREARSPSKTVKTGDIVSVRGVGKLQIGESSTTSKGKYRIEMKKYI